MPRFTALLFVGLIMAGCANGEDDRPVIPTTSPAFQDHGQLAFVRQATGDTIRTVTIEIADTEATRSQGLMRRMSVPDTVAMLFLFERPEPLSFWMRDTPRSLDIMFFGPDTTLLNIAKYTTPYSTDQIPSAGPAQFVVETQAGFADRFGIVEGDRIVWEDHRSGNR